MWSTRVTSASGCDYLMADGQSCRGSNASGSSDEIRVFAMSHNYRVLFSWYCAGTTTLERRELGSGGDVFVFGSRSPVELSRSLFESARCGADVKRCRPFVDTVPLNVFHICLSVMRGALRCRITTQQVVSPA